jgi:hypothetical protein
VLALGDPTLNENLRKEMIMKLMNAMLGIAACGLAGTIGLFATDAKGSFVCHYFSDTWTENLNRQCFDGSTTVAGSAQGIGNPPGNPATLFVNLSTSWNHPPGEHGEARAFGVASNGNVILGCVTVDSVVDGASTATQDSSCSNSVKFKLSLSSN